MVQLQNVNKSHCSLKDKLYLKGLFHRLRALIALNCSLIFVTDGSIPAIKLTTYRQRLKPRNEAVQDESNSCNVSSLRRNMGSEFSCMIKEAKLLGAALGIPCLDGIEEGEAQCALLDSESLCDGCFTSDSDAFLFGARTVYREICLGEGGFVVCYEMADIEKKLGFGRNSLITLALLLGSDYSPGVRGFGPESACNIVRTVGDGTILQKIASEGLSFAKKLKGSRKPADTLRCKNKENELDQEIKMNGNEYGLLSKDHFLRVIDAYVKPKCHSADSDLVHRVLAAYPFDRATFQHICAQFFDWSPEKTDEYILPKIAERDLRRFANLRSTSSELGVQLPLDEMPVKCPVSGIVKQRKVQGEIHFEVSWEHMDGLGTSIVPADLIECACPEKIKDFEERRAQAKKPNNRKPRPKKSDKQTSITEIERKLQNLLLDIEIESNASQKASSSIKSISNIQTFQLKDEDMEQSTLFPLEPKPNIESSRVAEIEVIDLSSPSYAVPRHQVSRCGNSDVERIDIIELNESETEASPQHTQKARDLRLFLASIKQDLNDH